MKVARSPAELAERERAVAIGTFDGVHAGHRRVLQAALAAGAAPTVVTFDPHPRTILGTPTPLLSTLERRLELIAALGFEEALVVPFDDRLAALEPEAFVDAVLRPIGTTSRRGRRELPLRQRPQRRPGPARPARVRRAARPARPGRVVGTDPRARPRARAGGRGRPARAPVRGRRRRRRGRTPRTCARLPDGEPRRRPGPAAAAVRHLRRVGARPPRGRVDRREPAFRQGRRSGSRPTCSTSTATSTGSGSWSSCGRTCATSSPSRARSSSSRRSQRTSRPPGRPTARVSGPAGFPDLRFL